MSLIRYLKRRIAELRCRHAWKFSHRVSGYLNYTAYCCPKCHQTKFVEDKSP